MDTALSTALSVARRWCTLVEGPECVGANLVALLAPALADLFAATLALPAVEPTSTDLDDWRPDDAEVRSRFADMQQRLGTSDSYWTTEDATAPLDAEPSALNLPVTDDVVDIWRDVATAVRAAEGGAVDADVAWELRFSCRTHWGRHATEALRALHARETS